MKKFPNFDTILCRNKFKPNKNIVTGLKMFGTILIFDKIQILKYIFLNEYGLKTPKVSCLIYKINFFFVFYLILPKIFLNAFLKALDLGY